MHGFSGEDNRAPNRKRIHMVRSKSRVRHRFMLHIVAVGEKYVCLVQFRISQEGMDGRKVLVRVLAVALSGSYIRPFFENPCWDELRRSDGPWTIALS